jgi:hypothetical protein
VAGHIGIALARNGEVRFFHSSGGRTSQYCDYNVGPSGGIRCVDIAQYLKNKNNYSIVRILIEK